MASVFPAQSPPSASDNPSPAAELRRRWRAGQQPVLEEFLAEQPAVSPAELAAIARIDLRQRWRQGERPQAEEYLARLPVLRGDPELAIDIIYCEYLAREERGEGPPLTDFLAPFPEFADEIAAQIQLHRALVETPSASREQDSTLIDSVPQTRIGVRPEFIGTQYQVLDELGRGGLGIVYRARQLGLNRLVALKMVRFADDGNPELFARFRAEAEAVARLHHPNIVQIFDYGEHEGLPYLVLELVEGDTLAARLDGQPWPFRRAAAWMASIARAVQFAHEQGVVHRDLKPANILLESRDGPAGAADSAKIADFGLAKVFREEKLEQTHSGSIFGTPSYMAPEQAGGMTDQIGPLTDVYSLSAILYELLAGRPAFQGPTVIATLQQVLTGEPVSLCRLKPQMPRDLATICAKGLSKEPRDRYASSAEFAGDLERFLIDRPILARRTDVAERTWRWCRRNPVVATLATSVAVLVLAVAAVSIISSVRIAAQLKQVERAETSEREAKQTAQLRLWDAYLAEITARTTSRQLGHRFAALETADRAGVLLDQIGRTPQRELQLRSATLSALALPDMRLVRRIDGKRAIGLACALDADRYVAAAAAGELLVCDLKGRVVTRVEHRGENVGPAISPDGRYVGMSDARGSKIWRIDQERPTLVWEEAGASRLGMAPDCRHAAVQGADEQMRWIDLASGHAVRALGRGMTRSAFAFHGPSQRIAVVGVEGVQVISWETGEVLAELPSLAATLTDVAWDPCGDYIAVSGTDDGVELWHVASGRRLLTYPHHGVVKLNFVHGGEYLLTHNIWDAHLRMWHTGTGQEVFSDPTFPHFTGQPTQDGRHVLLAIEATGVAFWEVESASACLSLPHGLAPPMKWRISASVSPDGRLLVVGGWRGLELWDLEAMQLAGRLESGVAFANFATDGSIVVRFGSGVFRWPRNESSRADGQSEIRFGPPVKVFGTTVEPKFAMSPDGNALVVRSAAGWRVIRSATDEQSIPIGPEVDPRTVALSNDGRWVAVGSWIGAGVRVFSARSGEQVVHFPTGPHAWPLFSPDGLWLATTPDGVRVWRVDDWQPAADVRARGDTASELGIAFSPDSRVLAVSQPTGTTRLVDPATGSDWAVLTDPGQISNSYLVFSSDQSRLITVPIEAGRPVRIWDVASLRADLSRRRLNWPTDVLSPLNVKAGRDAAAAPLQVSFDRGDTWSQEEAASLLSQARAVRNAARREFLVQVVQLDPGNANAHNELAWLLCTGSTELRNPPLALEHARRAVELGGNSHDSLNTLGVAQLRGGEFAESVATLTRALETSPPELAPFDLIFLAMAHAGLADWQSANDYFRRATAAIEAQRPSLTPGRLGELNRFLSEARELGLPR